MESNSSSSKRSNCVGRSNLHRMADLSDDGIRCKSKRLKAPEILGLDQNGKEIKLSDFKGKKLALYFYPKDNTSGCTAEACSLRDGYKELQAAGYEVVGVSKDSAKSHQGFIAKQELPFSLIADTDTTLQQQFGVWAEKKLYGRSYMGTLRTTFIIDEDGIVTNIIGPKEVKTKDHANQILNL